MKKNSRFSGIYLGIIFFLMYLPVVVVIIFSFNESKLPVRFSTAAHGGLTIIKPV